jgi:hypothetical protein
MHVRDNLESPGSSDASPCLLPAKDLVCILTLSSAAHDKLLGPRLAHQKSPSVRSLRGCGSYISSQIMNSIPPRVSRRHDGKEGV